MMAYKRGPLEIIAQILDSLLENPLKKTHITFRCNLDSRGVTKYLKIMKESGLIEIDPTNPTFHKITQQGIWYREKYQELMKTINIEYEDMRGRSITENIVASQY